jgi:ribosomal protein S18 acetylase RimI-like enzyme
MTIAYSGQPGDGVLGLSTLSYLPYYTTVNKAHPRQVEVGPFRQHEWQTGMDFLNLVIREGRSWPFDKEFPTVDAYRAYFLSHTALVVRASEAGPDVHGRPSAVGEMLGCFYIKPNFPGRCSHVCNGGFITAPNFRRMGIGHLMAQVFLRVARDVGYESAYFNLVFKSNTASVLLWESLGFQRVAELKNAAQLEGLEEKDTAYGYWYDLTTLPAEFVTGS